MTTTTTTTSTSTPTCPKLNEGSFLPSWLWARRLQQQRRAKEAEDMEEIESSGVGLLTIEWDMMDKSRFFGLRSVVLVVGEVPSN